MNRAWLAMLAALALALPLRAAEILPAANQRFANADPTAAPSFQRHVLPLLGRLGCNGRACHGSFQGQGGFRLSLFGYDFQSDLAALRGGEAPRVNVSDPAASLLLRKALQTERHKGGQRFKPDGWEHRLLLRWVQAGAPGVKTGDPEFASLEIEPRELVFAKIGQTAQLKVLARWADGSREDVTPLCRFRSNDEACTTVSEGGLVTATGPGDTDAVAFYDNGVATVAVLLPVSERTGPRYPNVPTPTRIDELVVAKLRKLGIVPADLCTDVEFLRRVSLDMTGTLPLPEEASVFLDDKAADKRARKIDELLERPAYAAWWTTRLCDWMGNSERTGPLGGEQGLNREKARQWYAWIHRRVKANAPYDELVEGVVLSVGRRPDQTFDDYCAEMSGYFRKEKAVDFSARPTMPYFWTRRSVGKPEDKALSFAHAFLGVSLQCAQCHKHPYDQWTKQDFDQFAAFFGGIRYGDNQRARIQEMKKAAGLTGDEDSGAYKRAFVDLVGKGTILPFKELTVPNNAAAKGGSGPKRPAGRVLTPRLLGGEEVVAGRYADPRQPLMDWLRQEENPYFARAFVNRVWANYFHVGLIEPPDDHNLANPPSNPEVLDYLSNEFVRRGYDMKWLHRSIASSRTYQLSWRPNDTNKHDQRNFSRAALRRLPAEVTYDAIAQATASDTALKALQVDPVSTRAIGVASGFAAGSNYAVTLFGKPARALNCDCERSNEPSLLQTVYLRNDPEVQALLERKDGWLRQVAQGRQKPEELVRQAYLRLLSRLPDEREAAVALKHLQQAPDRVAGLRDLMWALLNTKEFLVNR